MHIFEFGLGRIRLISDFLNLEKPKKILLLRGNKSHKLFEKKYPEIRNYKYVSFIVSRPYISFDYLLEGLEFYERNNCDLILAIGGGSVIDMGKLISIFSVNKGPFQDYILGDKKYQTRENKFVAVPTTAGSGSESTHFAVVYDGITKHSVAHSSLLPDYSIVDPVLTYSLTSNQTASSGMDAFCQAIESFWSIKSTKNSRDWSLKAIDLVLSNLETSVNNPNSTSRSEMAYAAHLAGKAINLTKTTAPHAISYPMTYMFNIPHGHAVSLTIGSFYEFNSRVNPNNVNDKRGVKSVIDRLTTLNKSLGVNTAKEASHRIKNLMIAIGLKTKLRNFGIKEKEQVDTIANNINVERLDNNPRKVSRKEIRLILNLII